MNFSTKKHFLLICFLIFNYLYKAQSCNTCTSSTSAGDSLVYNISKTDTSTYTLTTGQTLCIYSMGTFKGTLINNGGTICNKGKFFPKSLVFNSGVFINNKISKLKSALTLSSSSKLVTDPQSILNIDGSLTLSGGVLNNEGLINISIDLQNNSGTLTNKGIINCTGSTGSNTITNYKIGLVNIKN